MAAPARLILASASQARNRLLANAGLDFASVEPDVDEAAIRAGLAARGVTDAHAIASRLAAAKALAVAAGNPGGLVIGADQVLVIDGEILAKPEDCDAARAQLMRLRGRTHFLVSAVCCAAGDEIRWSAVARARLTMREFSTEFLEHYLAAMAGRVTSTVGAYEIEGRGVQLFSQIAGDLFTIQGLPLLDLIAYLRTAGLART
jgi:septum formation protein